MLASCTFYRVNKERYTTKKGISLVVYRKQKILVHNKRLKSIRILEISS